MNVKAEINAFCKALIACHITCKCNHYRAACQSKSDLGYKLLKG